MTFDWEEGNQPSLGNYDPEPSSISDSYDWLQDTVHEATGHESDGSIYEDDVEPCELEPEPVPYTGPPFSLTVTSVDSPVRRRASSPFSGLTDYTPSVDDVTYSEAKDKGDDSVSAPSAPQLNMQLHSYHHSDKPSLTDTSRLSPDWRPDPRRLHRDRRSRKLHARSRSRQK